MGNYLDCKIRRIYRYISVSRFTVDWKSVQGCLLGRGFGLHHAAMKFSMSWSLRRKVSGSPKLEVSLWLFPFLLLQNIEFASSLSCRSYLDRYSALRRVPRSSSSIVFKAKKVRQKKSSIVFLKSTSNDNNDNFELWQVGNVEQDLHNLEVALMYLNADENGYHDERMEALDSFAQSRYPVATQLRRFILQPLIWSFAAAFTLRRFRLAVGKFLQFSRLFSIVYFWAISVIAPTSLLLFLNFRRKGKYGNHTSSEQDSDDSCFSDVSYMTKPTKFGSRTRDARLSSCTNDYVQCLLEQWASCILGGAVAALSWLAISFVKPIEFRVNCVLLIQMITRWGIIASLRQYPPLWFALNRKQQPRPLNWPVWTTQQLIRIQRFTFCSAIDGTLLALSYPSISPCYVSSITLTAALWFCILQSEKWINSNERNSKNADSSLRSTRRRIFEESLYQAERMTRYVSFTALFLWMWYHAPSLFDFAQRVLERLSTKRLSSIFGMSRFYVAATTVLCVGLLVPGLHIAALCKLFHVSFMHDASLNMNIDLFRQSILADSKEFSWRWRCRLKWREPQRIPVVLGRWWERFWYWLFLEGSVDEKLQKESQRLLRGDTSVKSRGLHVLQRVETDPSTSYSGLDRTQWKTNAMEMIARKHQFDYERGSFDVSDHLLEYF